MAIDARPMQVKVLVALFLTSAIVMAAIGWSASAYYVPALGGAGRQVAAKHA